MGKYSPKSGGGGAGRKSHADHGSFGGALSRTASGEDNQLMLNSSDDSEDVVVSLQRQAWSRSRAFSDDLGSSNSRVGSQNALTTPTGYFTPVSSPRLDDNDLDDTIGSSPSWESGASARKTGLLASPTTSLNSRKRSWSDGAGSRSVASSSSSLVTPRGGGGGGGGALSPETAPLSSRTRIPLYLHNLSPRSLQQGQYDHSSGSLSEKGPAALLPSPHVHFAQKFPTPHSQSYNMHLSSSFSVASVSTSDFNDDTMTSMASLPEDEVGDNRKESDSSRDPSTKRRRRSSNDNENEYYDRLPTVLQDCLDFLLRPRRSNDDTEREDYKYPLGCCCLPEDSSTFWAGAASCIARKAPCFLCFVNPLEVSATDRAVLFRLNLLIAFFALVQISVGVFAVLLIYGDYGSDVSLNESLNLYNSTVDPVIAAACSISMNESLEEEFSTSPAVVNIVHESIAPNLWNLNICIVLIAFIGIMLLCAVVSARRVVNEVDLKWGLRYLWVLMWLLPIEFFFVLTLFDAHRVTDVWIKHWWRTDMFDAFRLWFCGGDDLPKCMMPVVNETTCCQHFFNATDCVNVREGAQDQMKSWAYAFYTINGVWGLVQTILVYLAMRSVEGIITRPIVVSSREGNIAGWFTLPIVGCTAVGSSLLFSDSSIIKGDRALFWIGVTYFVSGITFFLCALLGWFISSFSVLNNAEKKRKEFGVIIFIVLVILTIFTVAAVLAASLVYSFDLVDVDYDDTRQANLACALDTANSCTCCNVTDENCYNEDEELLPGREKCAEWSDNDVLSVLRTVLKQSACLAGMLLIYSLGSLRFGFVLRHQVKRYRIDYV